MAITELVIPFLKQDEETRNKFEASVIPQFQSTIGPAPGFKGLFSGRITSENNINIEQDVKYALGLEWETAQDFIDFFTGETFKPFATSAIKPLATAPAIPEVYATEKRPAEVFSSSITEVYRIRYGDETKLNLARTTWAEFTAAVKELEPEVPCLEGVSINLEEKIHLGMVGWNGLEERKKVLENLEVERLKDKLDAVDGLNSFTTAFGKP